MKNSVALIIITLLVFSGFGLAMERHFEYETAYENDKGIYIYFRVILLYSEMALDKIIAEDNESLYYAINVETKLNTTRDEIEFYKSFGIESKVENYLPPFLELSAGLRDIALGQKLFLDNIEVVKGTNDWYAYVNASQGLEMMGKGISSAERVLDVIDTFEFIDEDNTILTLDTSSLRKKLEKIKRMYFGYEKVLNAYNILPPDLLILYASNLNPFVYDNVTFYGYASGFDTVYLHIENQTIVLRAKDGRFSYVYSFDTVGKYEVFATGVKDGNVEKSNVLVINVVKIPTRIILSSKGSAYINESIRVSGTLRDYYGRPLKGEEVFGEFDGKGFGLITSPDGDFSFNVTSSESGRKIVKVTYPGNEIYAESKASLDLVFLKYPVRITIRADRDQIKEGETVKIIGEITGVNGEVPVEMYVDGTLYKSFQASKNFEVELGFNNTGQHEIYAYFPGNQYYDEAKSNVISIEVVEFSIMEFLLFALILILLGGIGYLARKVYIRRKTGITDEEFVKLMKALEELEKIEKMEELEKRRKIMSLREMYRDVYQKLLKYYNLKPSITPRELISRLRGENFSYYFERITRIHEKHVYGKRPLRRQDVLEFLRNVASFIASFIVREEL